MGHFLYRAEAFVPARRSAPFMNSQVIAPPQSNEYAPYYGRYVALIAGNDVLTSLETQAVETTAVLSARSEADGDLRYSTAKWSVKQLQGHVNDTERIFAYRALRIARADQTPIEGFEQDDYVRNGPFADRRLADLIEDFGRVRQGT